MSDVFQAKSKRRPFAGKARWRPKGEDSLLLDYQRRWVLDDSRLKIAEKSRQIGWSWASAYRLVRKKSAKGARLDAWVSSRDDEQARLFVQDCKSFSDILHVGAQDLGERVIDADGNTAHSVAFSSGCRINSMSSNPDGQAGKRGDRVLDEFGLNKENRKLYSIAYPGITWGGSLEIFSTHRGSANFFNQLIEQVKHKGNPKKFSFHRVTLQDALDQGFLFKLQSKLDPDDERQAMDEAAYFDFIKSGCADEESFLQEYMCVPADDASAFLPWELLDSCKYPATEQWQTDLSDCKNPLYIGVDIGRRHDLTVIVVLEKVSGLLLTRRLILLAKTPFAEQEAILYPLLRLPQVRRACIDETGIGMQFAERAKSFAGRRVEPVTFNGQVKEDLATNLRIRFEDHTLRIPDDRQLFAACRAIRKTTTAAGNVRFDAGRDDDGHADAFWALALAGEAARTTGTPGPIRIWDTARTVILRARHDRSIAC